MNLREHVVLGGAAAAALYPTLGPRDAAIFWAASVLIDVDHYWEYLSRNGFRNWSFRKTFEFHRALFPRIRDPAFLALNLFHTAEWFLLVSVAGIWLGSSAVIAAFWGMFFHLGLDVARLAWCGATFSRALSMVEYRIRRHALLVRGLDPDRPYRDALAQIGIAAASRSVPVVVADPPPSWPERQSGPPTALSS